MEQDIHGGELRTEPPVRALAASCLVPEPPARPPVTRPPPCQSCLWAPSPDLWSKDKTQGGTGRVVTKGDVEGQGLMAGDDISFLGTPEPVGSPQESEMSSTACHGVTVVGLETHLPHC